MTADPTPVRNPYVGPRPFETRDRDRFFGRKREVNELLSLIISERLSLIYAQSGAGKTSLVNAGLIPVLQQEGFEVLPPARVQGALPNGIALTDLRNPYTFNVLLGWSDRSVDPKQLAKMPLADFLQERAHERDELGLPAPRALILDQFEELYTTYPERWGDRERFLEQIAAALRADPVLRILLVMREEYIARLDPYASLLPGWLRARFHLERLRRPAALAAVTGPLPEGYAYGKGVAEQLVEDLLRTQVESPRGGTTTVTGEFVEPVQLQVVCRSLWQTLPPAVEVITREHFDVSGNLDQALSHYYEASLAQVSRESGVSERDLRIWFGIRLITQTGTRGLVHYGPSTTGSIPNRAVDRLDDLHLIRGQRRHGARWYELTHDCFIEPIRASNARWWREHGLSSLVTPFGSRIAHTVPAQALPAGVEPAGLESMPETSSSPQTRSLCPVPPPPDQPQASRDEMVHDVLAAAQLDWSLQYAEAMLDFNAQLAARQQAFNAEYAAVRGLT